MPSTERGCTQTRNIPRLASTARGRQVTRHHAHCALIKLCVKRVGGVAVSEKYSTAVTAKSFDTKFARFVDGSTFRVS